MSHFDQESYLGRQPAPSPSSSLMWLEHRPTYHVAELGNVKWRVSYGPRAKLGALLVAVRRSGGNINEIAFKSYGSREDTVRHLRHMAEWLSASPARLARFIRNIDSNRQAEADLYREAA